MPDAPKRYYLERRRNGAVVVEEGRIGVTDLAVFYPADHQLALAVTKFLNGDLDEALRQRAEWLARREAS